MVYFVGAGPGDPDLITIKGRKLIEKADIIIYAGSLVSAEHLTFAKPNCKTYCEASHRRPFNLWGCQGADG